MTVLRGSLGVRGWSGVGLAIAWTTLAAQAATTPEIQARTACTSAVEYVATLEYLRGGSKEYKVPEEEARTIALNVSAGCSGAALRFIKVVQVLSKAELGARDAVRVAIELSAKTDRETETFIAVFKRSYSEDSLDLDLFSAMKLARSLSTEFEGDVLAVREDFEKIVDFCVNEKKLDLPPPICAEMASRIARRGQAWSGGVSSGFLKIYEFARSNADGPKIPTGAALKLAEELTVDGPGAADNFIQGYRYASGSKGLALPVEQAMAFAEKMASYSWGGSPSAHPGSSARGIAGRTGEPALKSGR